MTLQFILSTVLSFAGIGIGICVIAINIYCVFKSKSKIIPILYTSISSYYIYSLISNLIRESSGVICARTPLEALLVFGILAVLHGYFLIDSFKYFKKIIPL